MVIHWEQAQCVDVARTEQRKVAAIKRCQLGLPQSLDNGQNRRIHEADVCVGVPVAELADPNVISPHELLNRVGASGDVVQQREEHARVQPRMDPVIDLDKHRRRDDTRFGGVLDQAAAGAMIGVTAVERCQERPGIKD